MQGSGSKQITDAQRRCDGCGAELPPLKRRWCSERCRVRAWSRANRDYHQQYRESHRELFSDATRSWREANPDARREYARRYDELNREKRRAHFALKNEVRKGRIVPPACCEQCGAEQRLHGHHEDYSKPLDVRWLCPICHAWLHAAVAA